MCHFCCGKSNVQRILLMPQDLLPLIFNPFSEFQCKNFWYSRLLFVSMMLNSLPQFPSFPFILCCSYPPDFYPYLCLLIQRRWPKYYWPYKLHMKKSLERIGNVKQVGTKLGERQVYLYLSHHVSQIYHSRNKEVPISLFFLGG